MGLHVSKTILNFFETQVEFNTIWVYTFSKFFFEVFVTFLKIKIGQNVYFFLWAIYTRLCWLHVHNQQDNNMLGHKKIES